MARVTTEDCLENPKIKNHFDLSICAAQRARNIVSGAPLTLETNNDKPVVIALREIAEQVVDPEVLRQKLVNGFLSSSHNSTLKEAAIEDDDLVPNERMAVETYYEDVAYSALVIVEEGDNSDGLNDEFTDGTSK